MAYSPRSVIVKVHTENQPDANKIKKKWKKYTQKIEYCAVVSSMCDTEQRMAPDMMTIYLHRGKYSR